MSRSDDEQYSAEEAQRRFEAALRGALKSPPKPHSEMKVGKQRKPKGSPARKPD